MTKVIKSNNGDFVATLDITHDSLTLSEYLSDAKDFDRDDDLSAEIAFLESKNLYCYELFVDDGHIIG